jgi:penicillin amidase
MGFASAEDRLWQLEWYRRRGEGRWAEVVGASGVDADVHFRRMGLAEASLAEMSEMSAETRSMFERYSAGVNAYIEGTDQLPVEYEIAGIEPEPWEPWHSILLFKVRHAIMGKWQLKLTRTELIQRIGPERYQFLESLQPLGQNIIIPPGGQTTGQARGNRAHLAVRVLERMTEGFREWGSQSGGSNSWAVHGSRVAGGKPVICNDSHRPLDVPNVYWQVHVSCPDFNAAGGAFPGFPAFPHFGHNGHVVWCITHAMVDNQDLYLEKFKKDDPALYLTEDGWKEAEIQTKTIEVRGDKPVALEIVRTRHGNLVAGDRASGSAIALRYTATDQPGRQWDCLRKMLFSKTVEDLFEAHRGWVDPVNNLLSADTAGSIGYMTRGRVPVRPTADARQFVVPGWSGEHEWGGDVPFEKLPRIINPPQGFISTANQRIVNGEDPYITYEFATPGRAERIAELLKEPGVLSPDQIASIQGDTLSVRARAWARVVEDVLDRSAPSAEAAKAAELMAGWDGDLRADSSEAVLYALFRLNLAREVFEPFVGAETWKWMTSGANPDAEDILSKWLYNLGDRMSGYELKGEAPDGRAWDAVILRVLEVSWREAVALTSTDDPREWGWGALHRTCAEHTLAAAFSERAERLNPPSVAMGGDSDTIQVSSYAFSSAYGGGSVDGRFSVASLSVYRQVVDLSDIAHAWWVIPAGASARADSEHCSDQLELWHAHRLVPMYFDILDVKAHSADELVLRP